MCTCDPGYFDPLPRVASYVRAQRVTDNVHLTTRHVVLRLNIYAG